MQNNENEDDDEHDNFRDWSLPEKKNRTIFLFREILRTKMSKLSGRESLSENKEKGGAKMHVKRPAPSSSPRHIYSWLGHGCVVQWVPELSGRTASARGTLSRCPAPLSIVSLPEHGLLWLSASCRKFCHESRKKSTVFCQIYHNPKLFTPLPTNTNAWSIREER